MEDLDSQLSILFEKAEKDIYYSGQPFKVLLAGSYCFTWVEEGSKSVSEISKFVTQDDPSQYVLTLRFLFDKNKKKYSFLSGIRRSFASCLSDFFVSRRVLADDIQPIAFLIARYWSSGGFIGNAVFKLRGITLIFGQANGSPIILETFPGHPLKDDMNSFLPASFPEKSIIYELIPDRGASDKNNRRSMGRILRSPILRSKRESGFYKVTSPGFQLSTRYVQALRVVSLLGRFSLILTLATLFMVSVGSLFADKSGYRLGVLERQFSRKLELQSMRDSLFIALNISGGKHRKTQFAALASAFCQGKPGGLTLTSLSIIPDEEKRLILTAEGKCRRENAVFEYQRMASSFLEGKVPEIVQLKSVNTPSSVPGQAPSKSFAFKLRLEAGDVKD
ncbi:MAG: hypothetical protein HRF51_01600 [bacterium]